MCCAQCLTKSGVASMRSAHAESQLPAIVAGATACMKRMEEGCTCQRWIGGARLQQDLGECMLLPPRGFPGCCTCSMEELV